MSCSRCAHLPMCSLVEAIGGKVTCAKKHKDSGKASKSSEELSPAHRLLRTCCGNQYDRNEGSKETEK